MEGISQKVVIYVILLSPTRALSQRGRCELLKYVTLSFEAKSYLLEVQPEIPALSRVERGAVGLHPDGGRLAGVVHVEPPALVVLVEDALSLLHLQVQVVEYARQVHQAVV